MQAHEIMNSTVYKVKDTDNVRLVIEKFIDHQISGLPVVNERNEIVAYISDGDIMRYIGKHKDIVVDSFYYVDVIKGDDDDFEVRAQKVLDLNVMAIAQKKVQKVAWDQEIENIERNGVLAGIISRGDVIRHSFKKLL